MGDLAERVGITNANLSILKNNKAKAIRFSTLEALCRETSWPTKQREVMGWQRRGEFNPPPLFLYLLHLMVILAKGFCRHFFDLLLLQRLVHGIGLCGNNFVHRLHP